MMDNRKKMNIVHIAPNATFDDGWGFQDNLLPKYHAKQGHNVTVFVNNIVHDRSGKKEIEPINFKSVDGFEVERYKYVDYKFGKITRLLCKLKVYNRLMEIKPDVVFYHGLISTTIMDVIKYKKQQRKIGKDCVIIQDNHLDYNIGNDFTTIKQKIIRSYYRFLNKISQKYVHIVYGVTPWREEYARDYYKISPLKTDVLIMGADDDVLDFNNRKTIREKVRLQYNIKNHDFLVITGGKIDEKKRILELMEACSNVKNVKLLVFGIIADDIKRDFDRILDNSNNIIYIGWIKSEEVYNYFFSADLAFFPGQHSVLWEQACASKIPCIFLRWPGMEHVNNGGNAEFIDVSDIDVIREKIQELCFTEKYYGMLKVADSEATDIYLYSEIAKKSLMDIKIK